MGRGAIGIGQAGTHQSWVAQLAGVACRRRAVLQVLPHRHLAFFFHLVDRIEAVVGAVGLGRGGQVERGFHDRIDAFRQTRYSIHGVMLSSLPVYQSMGSR